ncbi:MAG TPA: DUF4349 domain-containing protein [Solirubrobacterales bacterium]|nr:DUF4349 domain-containing protein [Solirubrobacterales bacterium]
MARFRDDADLAAALRAVRPTPHPDFAAELDHRAAAGFPRHAPGSSGAERLLAWARALRPRQLLMPAGAVALAAIVALVLSTSTITSESPQQGGGSLLSYTNTFDQGNPYNGFLSKGGTESPAQESGGSSSAASSEQAAPSAGAVRPFSSNLANRQVERSAEIVLGTDPDQVDDAAAEVFDAVHASNGIVLRSSIQNGSDAGAGAEFELLVPSGKLGDALAAFSRIGEVRARHEATADITAPTITVGEHLRDSRARIDGLLAQLAEATTESEREAVETELRGERRHSAALRSRLAALHRRANLSRVSLRIETGAAAAPSSEDSVWGVGDALDDAGRILGVAAAGAVIGLAILGPAALIALLAWLVHRAWLRRGRERALG